MSDMRTLSDIIDAAKDGEPTTHEECLYALLAYSSLHYFAASAIRRMHERPNSPVYSAERMMEEDFTRVKTALNKSPKEWVGWRNDPKNPEYQKMRAVGKKLIDKLAPR